MFAHRPDADPLAVMVRPARLLSLLFGLGTVLATYALARRIAPSRFEVALLAAGLTASLPGFLFISALVSNDAPIAFFGVLLLLAATAWSERRAGWGAIALAGIALGGAALTKTPGLLGAPLLTAAALIGRGCWKQRAAALGTAGGLALALAGWWYARNLLLYGDLTAMHALLGRTDLWNEVPTPGEVLADLRGLDESFIGLFGWFSVRLPDLAYDAYNGLFLLGVLGLLVSAWRRQLHLSRGRVLCLLWMMLVAGALLYTRLIFKAFHGRLLYPALGGFAVLWALGIAQLLPRRLAAPLAVLLLVGLAAVAWVVPPRTIRAAYTPRNGSTCARAVTSPDSTVAPIIALAAADAPTRDLHPGDELAFSLCWLARASPNAALSVSAQLVAPGERVLALHDGFPGSGNDATLWWKPGSLHEDYHTLIVPAWAPVPTIAELRVNFYDVAAHRRLLAIGPDGHDFIVVGRYRIVPPLMRAPDPIATFEDGTQLLGSDLTVGSRSITGTVDFGAARTPSRSHTASLQLIGTNGLVAQDDRLPRGGLFPSPDWRPGDVVPHDFVLPLPDTLPPGRYQFAVVLYDLPEGTRLHAGTADQVVLAEVCVSSGSIGVCP
ncbi:MAG TPA: phospholipid carrier-dependent glycosyltransferase [Chloroflexota bacterium]|nr:phospholipid carrier-dependent glycosyltransferase [Chloroflexota bacterium]